MLSRELIGGLGLFSFKVFCAFKRTSRERDLALTAKSRDLERIRINGIHALGHEPGMKCLCTSPPPTEELNDPGGFCPFSGNWI